MSASYISATKEALPKVAIVFDRFHVMKLANKMLDKIRMQEYHRLPEEERQFIKGSRFVLLKNYENLSEEEAVSSPGLTLRVKRAHLRARQANEMLRPEGGEFKNSWESMGPEESLSVSGDIRKGLEMKLRDISDRIKAARAFHISEKNIRLFSEASLEYVVALLDLTLIRSRKKHNKKGNSMSLRSSSSGPTIVSPLSLTRGQTI